MLTLFAVQVKIITQNIDGLHRPASEQHESWTEQYVEVHGRLGHYKCVKDKCKYAKYFTISPELLPPVTIAALSDEEPMLDRSTIPKCPECRSVIHQ